MKHTVKLRFFQDDANGEYGLAHETTFNDNNPFNAFWSGQGIFHDVFEHWFENEHKYFRGDYAMNVGGEMVAMGAFYYFIETLGVHNRPFSNGFGFRRSNAENMRLGTEGEVIEAISSGWCNFGSTLECNVPYQKPCSEALDEQCEEMYNNVKKAGLPHKHEDEYQFAKNYRKSVTLSKIKRLHRYGYRLAERMFPDNRENMLTLIEFIEYWKQFITVNNAQDLMNYFDGITFTITKQRGEIKWGATLNPNNSEIEPIILKQTKYVPDILEEIYSNFPE